MNCTKALSRLPLFAGGDLDLREHAAVEGHLEHCLPCYREFRRQAGLLERVQRAASRSRAELPPLGDAFTASVMGSIEGPPPLPRLVPRLIMVSGWAAALLLGVSLAFGPIPWPRDPAIGPGDTAGSAPDPGALTRSDETDAVEPQAWIIPTELLSQPGAVVPLHRVQDTGEEFLPPTDLDPFEQAILGNRFGATPVSYPGRVRDY